MGCFLEVGKDLEKSINLHLHQNQAYQHHLCDSASLWMWYESWVISGDMENKINAFATSCFRIMLNIKRLDCVSTERIYHLTNTQPLINTVRQRQLRFLGHILRMPEEEPYRRYALYVPTHGRRTPGRQRISYLFYLQKPFGGAENDLNQDAIALLAADRCAWRKFVVACSAAEWWMKKMILHR